MAFTTASYKGGAIGSHFLCAQSLEACYNRTLNLVESWIGFIFVQDIFVSLKFSQLHGIKKIKSLSNRLFLNSMENKNDTPKRYDSSVNFYPKQIDLVEELSYSIAYNEFSVNPSIHWCRMRFCFCFRSLCLFTHAFFMRSFAFILWFHPIKCIVECLVDIKATVTGIGCWLRKVSSGFKPSQLFSINMKGEKKKKNNVTPRILNDGITKLLLLFHFLLTFGA